MPDGDRTCRWPMLGPSPIYNVSQIQTFIKAQLTSHFDSNSVIRLNVNKDQPLVPQYKVGARPSR